jgi:hypothetical protein
MGLSCPFIETECDIYFKSIEDLPVLWSSRDLQGQWAKRGLAPIKAVKFSEFRRFLRSFTLHFRVHSENGFHSLAAGTVLPTTM